MRFSHLIALIILCIGCDGIFLGDEDQVITLEENLAEPVSLSDGIGISSLEEENIETDKIHGLIADLHVDQPSKAVRSMLIARNGRLVSEAYFNGWNRERRQDIRSATKSFTSALIGIAIDQGFVSGVDDLVLSYFSSYESFENTSTRKSSIRIEDLLRMRTGLACNDRIRSSPGNEENMYETNDWIKFILDLPAISDPGSFFAYCTGAPVTLGGIISNATNQPIPEFAEQNLFAPLGISDYDWEFMPNGRTDTGGHLHLRPRDMMKFGLLFLNQGQWNGQQVISSDWVLRSTALTAYVPPGSLQYGYLWWGKTFIIDEQEVQSYFASGNGGQYIFVVPSLEAVVVFTGGNYNSKDHLSSILNKMEVQILPSFK